MGKVPGECSIPWPSARVSDMLVPSSITEPYSFWSLDGMWTTEGMYNAWESPGESLLPCLSPWISTDTLIPASSPYPHGFLHQTII
jgi:hypothetical protein